MTIERPMFPANTTRSLDINDIQTAVHEIGQMVLVALGPVEDLVRSDVEPGFSHLPAAQAEMLCFALYDLHKRVAELKGLVGAA